VLTGKVALVTGGSGAIGSAICRVAAKNGAKVAFTYHRNSDGAASLLEELRAISGAHLSAELNYDDFSAIEGFAERVEAELGGIDALVNNLGITQVMPFALIEEDDWDQMIEVNLKSMFFFTKAAVRRMIRRRCGAVINMSSAAGHRILEVPVHYATAKAAVMGFTTSLAGEMKRYGIRVNAVAPGLVEGGIGQNISPRQLEEYNRFCATGRPGTPEEIAELVVFLASPLASYLNGQTIFIDGGI